MKKIDAIDLELLRMLQEDAETPMAELAAAVSLSSTPCWRRIQRLKDEGVISKQVVLLDRHKINLGVTVFVSIRTNKHTQAWFDNFHAAVRQIPEIVELNRMTGEVDYLMRVVVPTIGAYDDVYKRLIRVAELYDVSSSFSMEEIKRTTALPLNHVG